MAVCIELLGQRYLDTVDAMARLAATLRSRGQVQEAERLEREVLEMRIELLDDAMLKPSRRWHTLRLHCMLVVN